MSRNTYLNEIETSLGKSKTQRILDYMEYILEKNNSINLTAVKDIDEAIEKHLVDSLTIRNMPEYQEAETVIDIGTGAGFPGVILAIADPEKEFTLMDSLNKRIKVIDEGVRIVGVDNITTIHARAEENRNNPQLKEQFDLGVSRAVAKLDKLCKWGLPFIKQERWLLAYKGENVSRETLETREEVRKSGGTIARIQEFDNLPESISGHNIVVIKKK